MIGNDIIDIVYTRKQSNWERKGWVQKIFNSYEQDIIFDSNDPFTTVWRLWSMKESVYKLHLRGMKKRAFHPSIISCKILDNKIGLVEVGGIEYHTETRMEYDYIFTSTATPMDKFCKHHIVSYDTLESKNHYEIIINQISNDLGWDRNQVVTIKNKLGIPELYLKDKKQEVYLSITHHGKYFAFSVVRQS